MVEIVIVPRSDMQPNMIQPRPLAQKLWEVPEYHERYLAKIRELVDAVADPDTLLDRMTSLRAMIETWAELEKRSIFTLDQFRRALTENIQTGSSAAPPPGTPRLRACAEHPRTATINACLALVLRSP